MYNNIAGIQVMRLSKITGIPLQNNFICMKSLFQFRKFGVLTGYPQMGLYLSMKAPPPPKIHSWPKSRRMVYDNNNMLVLLMRARETNNIDNN
jgi:hypothetical protein